MDPGALAAVFPLLLFGLILTIAVDPYTDVK